MKYLGPIQLDSAPTEDAVKALCSRFPWLRSYRSQLTAWIDWQETLEPRPNFYFRWHLPRFCSTLELVERAVRANPAARILDLAAFAPYAYLMERYLSEQGLNPTWVRTSLDGADAVFNTAAGEVRMPTAPLVLGDGDFPFASGAFDLVLFTEVIEHLPQHPQHVLFEINRVCRTEGHVLVTTPNLSGWKKLRALSNGTLDYDSPTFGGDWGHRHEYTYYQLHQMLAASGFQPNAQVTRDVYFDDPAGVRQAVEFAGLATFKLATGQPKAAVKLVQRKGSGLFFLYRKAEGVSREQARFVII